MILFPRLLTQDGGRVALQTPDCLCVLAAQAVVGLPLQTLSYNPQGFGYRRTKAIPLPRQAQSSILQSSN